MLSLVKITGISYPVFITHFISNASEMTNKKSRKIKKGFSILLALLILLLISGIWLCPKHPDNKARNYEVKEDTVGNYPEQHSQEEQAASPLDSNTLVGDLKNKEDGSLSLAVPEKKEPIKSATNTALIKKEVLPPVEKVEKVEKSSTPEPAPDNQNKSVEQTPEKEIDNSSSTRVAIKPCTSTARSKINKSAFQRCVAFSPDGTKFVVGNNNKFSSIYDLNGKEISKLIGHQGYILAIAYAPNGKTILTGSVDKTAKLWDAASGNLLKNFEGHTGMVSAIAVSPDGKYMITSSKDGSVKLWDINSGKEIRNFQGHNQEVNTVAFSPNGQYILTGSADKTAKLWDVRSGEISLSLEGHNHMVRTAIFSPDGKFIITGSADKTVKIWDAQTGKTIRTLNRHKKGIRSVAISSDGHYLLTGSSDHSVKLWHIKSGRELCQLTGHSSSVNEVAFSPNSNNIAVSVSNDNSIRIWDIELE